MIDRKINKKTRQGNGKNTKYSASSRNAALKKYRWQGKNLRAFLDDHCKVHY